MLAPREQLVSPVLTDLMLNVLKGLGACNNWMCLSFSASCFHKKQNTVNF